MARVIVIALALALVGVLAPSPFGPVGVVRSAPVGHTASAPEEEPVRECRGGPEARSLGTRSSPAGTIPRPRRALPAAHRRPAPTTTPPVSRNRDDCLRAWSTPSALQVFRN
ncbi:hypothetical protein ACIGNX_04350 [Actinosynnema sp. NPDC053489]|uniref:hypothetical protein n=1 Tax=Actinosynnema sp. NPDC053489 TaxID=3363916 RepID=UPI0037CA2E8C